MHLVLSNLHVCPVPFSYSSLVFSVCVPHHVYLPPPWVLLHLPVSVVMFHRHHHHLFLNREGLRGTTDDFTTSFLHFSLFSTALWDLANSRPVHSLMLGEGHVYKCPLSPLPLRSCPFYLLYPSSLVGLFVSASGASLHVPQRRSYLSLFLVVLTRPSLSVGIHTSLRS